MRVATLARGRRSALRGSDCGLKLCGYASSGVLDLQATWAEVFVWKKESIPR